MTTLPQVEPVILAIRDLSHVERAFDKRAASTKQVLDAVEQVYELMLLLDQQLLVNPTLPALHPESYRGLAVSKAAVEIVERVLYKIQSTH